MTDLQRLMKDHLDGVLQFINLACPHGSNLDLTQNGRETKITNQGSCRDQDQHEPSWNIQCSNQNFCYLHKRMQNSIKWYVLVQIAINIINPTL